MYFPGFSRSTCHVASTSNFKKDPFTTPGMGKALGESTLAAVLVILTNPVPLCAMNTIVDN